MSSLDVWRSDFGDEYTARNQHGDPVQALRQILAPHWQEINSVLEVGCNTGRNLAAFKGKQRLGVEPNAHARAQANKAYTVYDAHAGALPVPDGSFDLVFTAGVLIHIGPDELNRALYEIHRASRRFILAIEYHAERETAVEYRGHKAGIWKRNYMHCYLDRFPVTLIGHGDETSLAQTAFHGSSWQLFDKRP